MIPETPPPDQGLPPQRIAAAAAALGLEIKATDVVILDLRELDAVCDYYVLMTGASDPQIKAIVERVDDGLRKQGERPWHIEGLAGKQWVLLDYVDVVVHVFSEEARDLYMLERLWGDAPREVVDAGVEST